MAKYASHNSILLLNLHLVMRKSIYILLAVTFLIISETNHCCAQVLKITKERLEGAANLLDFALRHRKNNMDTMYVQRPNEAWTMKLNYNQKSTYFKTSEMAQDIPYHYLIENTPNSSISASVNYRGIALSLSISPKKLFGKSTDTEFNFNYYNNKFGADITYSNMNHFHSTIKIPSISTAKIESGPLGETQLKGYSVNAYYVFNNKKFSYPAAFSHSWIQKKSSGSFIAGMALYSATLDFDLGVINAKVEDYIEYSPKKTEANYVAVNFGYAYNFIPNKHWLVHVSVAPGLMLWKDYSTDVYKLNSSPTSNTSDYTFSHTHTWPKRFFDIAGIARIGITYSWKKYFIGANYVAQLDYIGDSDIATVLNNHWKFRSYFGFRL